MLRRLVSKFNVELPVGSPSDLYIPFNGDVTRQIDDKELYFFTHLCEQSLPHEEMDLAIADMRSAGMNGFGLLDSFPCCRGHHVPLRIHE